MQMEVKNTKRERRIDGEGHTYTEEGAGPGEGRDRRRQLKRWQEGISGKKEKSSRPKTVEETGAVRQSEKFVTQRGTRVPDVTTCFSTIYLSPPLVLSLSSHYLSLKEKLVRL